MSLTNVRACEVSGWEELGEPGYSAHILLCLPRAQTSAFSALMHIRQSKSSHLLLLDCWSSRQARFLVAIVLTSLAREMYNVGASCGNCDYVAELTRDGWPLDKIIIVGRVVGKSSIRPAPLGFLEQFAAALAEDHRYMIRIYIHHTSTGRREGCSRCWRIRHRKRRQEYRDVWRLTRAVRPCHPPSCRTVAWRRVAARHPCASQARH
jgi:hypothetical protein